MTARHLRLVPVLALLLAAPASAAPGTQTIHYVKDQAFLNMNGPFIAGDSGAGCYALGTDPSQLRVGGCGFHFNVPRAQPGAAVVLHLKDQAAGPVRLQWTLTDEDHSAVCAEGAATGDHGEATAAFTLVGDCRVVTFLGSGAITAGTVTLTWSA